MADDNNKKGKGKFKVSMTGSSSKLSQGVLLVHAEFKRQNDEPAQGLDVAWVVEGIGQLDHTSTNDDGKTEREFKVPEGARSLKVRAEAVSDPKSSFERKFDIPEKPKPASSKKLVFKSETGLIKEGMWNVHIVLMDAESRTAGEGKIRITPTKPFKLQEKGSRAWQSITPAKGVELTIPKIGAFYTFLCETQGVCEMDIFILGHPDSDAEMRIYGPREQPVAIDEKTPEKSTMSELLFKGMK